MYAELVRKKCSVCKKRKIDNGKNWYRNQKCAACYMKQYKKEFPDRIKDARLKCYYGLTLVQFNRLMIKQKAKCAICKSDKNETKSGKIQSFVVDHCHKTNKIRGLLCHTCNMRVGVFENWNRQIEAYLRSARSRG